MAIRHRSDATKVSARPAAKAPRTAPSGCFAYSGGTSPGDHAVVNLDPEREVTPVRGVVRQRLQVEITTPTLVVVTVGAIVGDSGRP
jgi:hypothetical protein